MSGPRADFFCADCEEKGEMPEPVELPLRAKVCPLCGGGELRRVWTPPGVIVKNGAEPIRMTHEQIQHTDALMRPELERRDAQRAPANFGARAVAMGNVSGELSKISGGNVVAALPGLGKKANVIDRATLPGLAHPHRRTTVVGRYTGKE